MKKQVILSLSIGLLCAPLAFATSQEFSGYWARQEDGKAFQVNVMNNEDLSIIDRKHRLTHQVNSSGYDVPQSLISYLNTKRGVPVKNLRVKRLQSASDDLVKAELSGSIKLPANMGIEALQFKIIAEAKISPRTAPVTHMVSNVPRNMMLDTGDTFKDRSNPKLIWRVTYSDRSRAFMYVEGKAPIVEAKATQIELSFVRADGSADAQANQTFKAGANLLANLIVKNVSQLVTEDYVKYIAAPQL